MAQNFRLATPTKQAAGNAAADLVDVAAPGDLIIYAGSVPADADTALDVPATHQILATFALKNPAFLGTGTNGINLLDLPATVQASASGTPSFFRIYDGNGATVFQGTVGTAASDLIVDISPFVATGDVSIVAGAFTVPEGT